MRILTLTISTLGSLLLLRAAQFRFPKLTRAFWEDEIHQTHAALETTSFADLLEKLGFHHQPMLDYALRKYFWFPWFGHQELQTRYPNLFFGLATVLAGFVIAYLYYRTLTPTRRWMSGALSVGLAFCVGMYLCSQPAQVYYSAEARQYTLVSLTSLLWAAVFVLGRFRTDWPLAAASLLYFNTHFFAAPFILAAYAFRMLEEIKKKKWKQTLFLLLTVFLIFKFTLTLNKTAYHWLTHMTPSQVSGASKWDLLKTALPIGWSGWKESFEHLALPISTTAVSVAVFLGLLTSRANSALRVIFLLYLTLPAFLVYVRMKSEFPFQPKYFLPMIGIYFVALIYGLGVVIQWVREFETRGMPGISRIAAAGVLIGLLSAFGLPQFGTGLANDWNALSLPKELNFSPYYKAYSQIRETGKPVFVLHSHCYCSDIPLLYFKSIPSSYSAPYEIADTVGCDRSVSDAQKGIQNFLKRHPDGILLLDQRNEECPGDVGKPPKGGWRARVEKLKDTDLCMWRVEGAQSVEEVGAIAKALGMRFKPEFEWKTRSSI